MSIVSDALNKRTTWSAAASQLGQWVAQILGPQPTAQATQQAGVLLADLKQSTSDAISLADTLMGPLLAAGALAVETAADAALKAAIGPVASIITPAMDTAISDVETQLIAAIRTRTAAFRASLAPKPSAPAVPSQSVQTS